MGTVYEIEGDLITRVERQVSQVGRLSDLLPSLTTYKAIEMGSLPRDCTYVKAEPDPNNGEGVQAHVIVSQPPTTRRIVFNESHGRAERQTAYTIAIPYAVFHFSMHGTPRPGRNGERAMLWAPRAWATAWMRRQQGNIATDRAITAMMPNTWGDGRVCFGNNPIDADQTMGQYINGLINTYWTSQFNTDLGVRTPYGTTPRSSLRRWEDATRRDRNVWQHWDVWQNETALSVLIANTNGADWTSPVPDSVEPIVPEPPRVYTFHSVRSWLLERFDEPQRNRLLWALTNADIEATPEDPDHDDITGTDERPSEQGLDDRGDSPEPGSDAMAERRDDERVAGAGEHHESEPTAPGASHPLDSPTIHRARRRTLALDSNGPFAVPVPDDEPNGWEPEPADG